MNVSLKGLRVLNTRPQGQAQPLSTQINEAGGIAIEFPTLEIQAKSDWLPKLPNLQHAKLAIFISANAVEHCFNQLNDWPAHIKVIAIGQGTAQMLLQHRIPVTAIPPIADSEHLLSLSCLQNIKQQTILLFKGEGGRTLIAETLENRGAHLIALDVYQRVLPKINHQLIKSIWQDNLVDIILLTSEQSLRHLFQIFAKEAHPWLRQKTYLVLSERLAQTATTFGIRNIILSHPHDIMQKLFDYRIKD